MSQTGRSYQCNTLTPGSTRKFVGSMKNENLGPFVSNVKTGDIKGTKYKVFSSGDPFFDLSFFFIFII